MEFMSIFQIIFINSSIYEDILNICTLTSMCFSEGSKKSLFSYICTEMFTTSARSSSYPGVISRLSFSISRILFWVARNIERFWDSWRDWGSAITFKNWAALKTKLQIHLAHYKLSLFWIKYSYPIHIENQLLLSWCK